MSRNISVKEKFRETVRRWRLFDSSEGLLVAVSGGIDSVVLLHLLRGLSPSARPKIRVAHFNHRLRGKASDGDERFVKGLCRAWGIPCDTGRSRPWRSRENLEARARESRYDFLRKTAGRRKIRKIATAHQADDQAETFLIRWLQGAGLRGLAGISLKRPVDGKSLSTEIIRPLLLISRREIADYAKANRLRHCDDPTNVSDDFLRSRVRKLTASLKRENPNLMTRNAVNAIFLRADEAYLESLVDEIFQRGAERKSNRLEFRLSRYSILPAAARFRLLQRMAQGLMGRGHALPAEAVLKLDELLMDSDPRKRYDLPSALGFRKERGRFQFFRKK